VEIISIIGLLLGIAVLVVGAYKGLGALPLTLIASLVVMLTNGMHIWDGFALSYMTGYAGTYIDFFLMFCAASLYANLVEKSGTATAIGYKFIDWFGKKRILLVTTLLIAVLTYGGVNLFVIIFAVVPIIYLLFKEANLPRHLVIAPALLGAATFTMTAMPGTPAITNMIPANHLGTPLTSAPIMGIAASVIMFVIGYIYMVYAEKKVRAAGEGWSYPDGIDPTAYEASRDHGTLPKPIIAFLPLIVLLATLIALTLLLPDGTPPVMIGVIGMLLGSAVTLALNWKRLRGPKKDLITRGLEGGISAIGGLAAVLAFGAVVSSSMGFALIRDWLLNLNVNPYVQGVLATSLISAVTGSSSGGLGIMYGDPYLLQHFINTVPDLQVLHRLTALAAGTLDTLPHAGALFLAFSVLRLNHKNSYKHVFWVTVVPGVVAAGIMLAVAVLFL